MAPITLDVAIRYQCTACGAERDPRDVVLAAAGDIFAQPCPVCACCYVTPKPRIDVLPEQRR